MVVCRFSEWYVPAVAKWIAGVVALMQQVLDDQSVMAPDALAQVVQQIPHCQGLLWRPICVHGVQASKDTTSIVKAGLNLRRQGLPTSHR